MNQSPAPSFSVGRILLLLIPIAVVVVGVFVFLTVFDGAKQFAKWNPTPPATVSVTGTVTLDGKPVSPGKIVARPVEGNGPTSEVDLDGDGGFSLTLAPGATEIRVTATAGSGEATPEEKDNAANLPDLSATPSVYHVSSKTELNRWTIAFTTADGKVAVSISSAGGTPVPTNQGKSRGGGAVGPEEISRRAIESYDTDGDGKLHGKELEEALGFFGDMLKNPDENGDGYVDSPEILSTIRRNQGQ